MTDDSLDRFPERSRSERHHDLITSLTTISAQIQLTQRRLLRADGLLNLEREMMLNSLGAATAEIRRLAAQLEILRNDEPPSGDGESTDPQPST